jgi:hypothetical protein
MTTPMTIRAVAGAQDIQQVRVLFRENASTLGFDLCFQNFEQELADLPGPYEPPSGCLLLAVVDDEPAGCVALRKLTDGGTARSRCTALSASGTFRRIASTPCRGPCSWNCRSLTVLDKARPFAKDAVRNCAREAARTKEVRP